MHATTDRKITTLRKKTVRNARLLLEKKWNRKTRYKNKTFNYDCLGVIARIFWGINIDLFKDRKKYEVNNGYNTDAYKLALNISREFGWDKERFGLTGIYNRDGYLTYYLSKDEIDVGKENKNKSIVVAFTGIAVDEEGYPLISRKQANALAAVAGKYTLLKSGLSGKQKGIQLLEFLITESARLVQAASVPEYITDNELDALLDAKTTFNRKTYRRPTKYSR